MDAYDKAHGTAVVAGEYVCKICYQSFQEENLLNEHSLLHNDETLIFNYWEGIQTNPLKHLDMVHASFEALYKSDVCQKSSKKKRKLSKQKSTLVDTHSDKQHMCDICQKVFKKKSHLVDHHFTHTSEKPYVCEFCRKDFSRKSNLITHVQTHVRDKTHVCHICQKGFAQRKYLLTHILIHEPAENKSHICEVCQKNFAQRSNLMRHRILHTGKKPYVCDICNKSFPRRSQLVSHEVVHSSVKQYICEICQKQFLRKAHYVRHKVVHSGIKPYKCNICQKGFSRKGHLETHHLNKCLKQMQSSTKGDVSKKTVVCLRKQIDSLQVTPQHDSQITETEVQLNSIDASDSSKPTDKIMLSNILLKNELDTNSETTVSCTEVTESTECLKIKVKI